MIEPAAFVLRIFQRKLFGASLTSTEQLVSSIANIEIINSMCNLMVSNWNKYLNYEDILFSW